VFGVQADGAETIRLIYSPGYQWTVHQSLGGDNHRGRIEDVYLLIVSVTHGYLELRAQIIRIIGVAADEEQGFVIGVDVRVLFVPGTESGVESPGEIEIESRGIF